MCCSHLKAAKTLDGSVSILHPRPSKIHRMFIWLASFSQAGTLNYTWQVRNHMQLEDDMRREMPSPFLDSDSVAAMHM